MKAAVPAVSDGTTQLVDTDRRVFVVRLADQGMWSAGFFLVNMTGGFTMSATDYAALSLTMAIAFIAVAVMRAWSVYSFVVTSGRRQSAAADFVDGRAGWVGAFVIGLVAAVVVGAWLSPRLPMGFAVLCGIATLLIVVSDLPRQLLIAAGDHQRTLPLSGLYLLGGIFTLAAFVVPVAASWYLAGWAAVLAVIAGVGAAIAPRGRAVVRDAAEHGRVAWRLGAEALYLAAASQAGVLMLFALHDPESTAGFRFAYSLVFAPAFVIIQGLQPVMVRQAASAAADGPRRSAKLAVLWSAGQTGLLVALGTCLGVGLWLFASAPGPRAAIMFIVPLGIYIASAQIFESAVLATRFFVEPALVHRGRLATVLLDVGAQVAGIVLGGPAGLAIALVVFGSARVIGSLVLLRWLRATAPTTVGQP